MADDAKASSKDKEEDRAKEEVSPVSEEAEPKKEVKAEAPSKSDLPDALKDKSPEEMVKMYQNLEKKLGEQSGEVKQARDTQDKMNIVLQAIWRNPDLYKNVEKEIQAMTRGDEPLGSQPVARHEDKAGKTEAGKGTATQDADQRRYLENQIISDFQTKFGLNKLPPKERNDAMQKISTAWADMVDPKGVKTKQELLSNVGLDVLPQQLENAYWIANKESLIEKGTLPVQDTASIPSMTGSSSGKPEGSVELSPKERGIAEKLGISPDKYAKRKQQIRSEFTEE